jgi:hypothetical protein
MQSKGVVGLSAALPDVFLRTNRRVKHSANATGAGRAAYFAPYSGLDGTSLGSDINR